MRRVTVAVSILATALLTGCGDSAGSPLMGGSKNAGEKAIQELFQANSYTCAGQPNVSHIYYNAPGRGGTSTYATWFQFGNLKYEVHEVELTGADKMNGVTFAGWIVFDDDTTHRVRRAWQTPSGGFEPFGPWGNWEPIRNSVPERSFGHYLEKRNGQFLYSARGSSFYGELSVLKHGFSPQGLRGVRKNQC